MNTVKQRKEVAEKLLSALKKRYPSVKSALTNWKTDWQFLFSIVLSAQCTDKKVNEVTEKLWKKYKTLESLREVKLEELQKDIFSTGFYRSKSKHLKNGARMILEEFSGVVPKNIKSLIKIPGVARKTANVFLSQFYGTNEGIAVDTHVRRITKRFGLTENDDPTKIEKDLMKLIPQKDWGFFSISLVEAGRNYWQAKSKSEYKIEDLNS